MDKLGSEAASEAFPKFVECLNHLNEMADILVNNLAAQLVQTNCA